MSEKLRQRLDDIKAKLADPNHWPPASSAEEELTFAMLVGVHANDTITGQSPGEIKKRIQYTKKSLVVFEHGQCVVQLRIELDPLRIVAKRIDAVTWYMAPTSADLAESLTFALLQAVLGIPDAQSPVVHQRFTKRRNRLAINLNLRHGN